MLPSNQKEENQSLSIQKIELIELIADVNIPYAQLDSPSWDNFIH